jgi:hypothetical protein
LFESGFEVLNDFLGQQIGVGKIVGLFEAFVSEPEDVEAGFGAVLSIAYSSIQAEPDAFPYFSGTTM